MNHGSLIYGSTRLYIVPPGEVQCGCRDGICGGEPGGARRVPPQVSRRGREQRRPRGDKVLRGAGRQPRLQGQGLLELKLIILYCWNWNQSNYSNSVQKGFPKSAYLIRQATINENDWTPNSDWAFSYDSSTGSRSEQASQEGGVEGSYTTGTCTRRNGFSEVILKKNNSYKGIDAMFQTTALEWWPKSEYFLGTILLK